MDRQESKLSLEVKKRQKEGHEHTGRGKNLVQRSKSAELGKKSSSFKENYAD